MSVVKRVTPETVPVERYRGRCEGCDFITLRAIYVTTVETLAGPHVRETGHTVAIEESEV